MINGNILRVDAIVQQIERIRNSYVFAGNIIIAYSGANKFAGKFVWSTSGTMLDR